METTTTPLSYRFVLDVRTPEGRLIHGLRLERADFARAVEETFFDALRAGDFAGYAVPTDGVRIVPTFRGDGPRSAGFEVILPTPAGERRERFGLEFFKTLARRTGAQLALAGKVAGDATVAYHLAAFAEEPVAVRRAGLTIELDEEPATIPIREGSRAALGVSEAIDAPGPDDFPVLIPRHVVEESVTEARRAPDREVGGVLLGHLRRGERAELFLEVSCLVPCEQTEATGVSVTFTHDTWARVREVADWRGEGELIVGWMHSHPFRLCAECPAAVPPECRAKILFYSADDEFLMELTFPRPFMVGLLAAVDPKLEAALGRPPVKLFGWKGGVIVPRGFEVVEG